MAVNKIILNDNEIEIADDKARKTIGSGTLQTTAQTLIGGINEIDSKVGSGNLATVAQTLIGGINELDTKVGNGILTTDNKALIGSVNEINEKISTINGNITDINQTITNIGSSTSGGIFKTTMGIASAINQSINGCEYYLYKYSLNAWVSTFEGYKPFMLLNAYANNGIVFSDMIYNENNNELTIYLYNPYDETRNTGTIHFTILFIKDGLYITS